MSFSNSPSDISKKVKDFYNKQIKPRKPPKGEESEEPLVRPDVDNK